VRALAGKQTSARRVTFGRAVWTKPLAFAADAAGFTNRVAKGCDSCCVRGLLGDIRRSTSPPRDHKLEGRRRVRLAQILDLLAVDSQLNVDAGELDARLPDAPTTTDWQRQTNPHSPSECADTCLGDFSKSPSPSFGNRRGSVDPRQQGSKSRETS